MSEYVPKPAADELLKSLQKQVLLAGEVDFYKHEAERLAALAKHLAARLAWAEHGAVHADD